MKGEGGDVLVHFNYIYVLFFCSELPPARTRPPILQIRTTSLVSRRFLISPAASAVRCVCVVAGRCGLRDGAGWDLDTSLESFVAEDPGPREEAVQHEGS